MRIEILLLEIGKSVKNQPRLFKKKCESRVIAVLTIVTAFVVQW